MEALNGIDISHHQGAINLAKIPCDFIIMKASQGTTYKDPFVERYFKFAKQQGKIKGLYHFADGKSSGKKEADFFLEVASGKIGDAFLVLDWEMDALKKGVGYAKEFLDQVKAKTGITPLIYMSASVTREHDWSSVAGTYPLWVAQYANSKPTGYQTHPWHDNKGLGAWQSAMIRQYSSTGRLPGHSGNLDLDIMYEIPQIKKAKNTALDNKGGIKTIAQIAGEVIAGKWGNGEQRRIRLAAAGYSYMAVMAAVNAKLDASKKEGKKTIQEIAREVIAGKWGTGSERTKKLKAAGYDPEEVQKEVNKLLK